MAEREPYPDIPLLIGGVEITTDAWIDVEDPASATAVGRVAKAGEVEIEAALAAAAAAFPVWRDTPLAERRRVLMAAASGLRQRAHSIASLLTAEQGKPLGEARIEVLYGADVLEHAARAADGVLSGRLLPPAPDGSRIEVRKVPLGPVAAFTPWNFPITQSARKIGPALVCGCTMVLKPAEETPAAVFMLAKALHEAGLPPGVLNIIYGDPAEISDRLIADGRVRKVSFTGSAKIGAQIGAGAGKHLKPVTLELGGHAPVIVRPGADLDAASQAMAGMKFRNAGQVCISPTRFVVDDAVFDAFADRFERQMNALVIGDGHDSGVTMGPLANARRVQAVRDLVEEARGSATLREGPRGPNREGHWMTPVMVMSPDASARILHEEPFGPVAIFSRVNGLDEAIAEANRLEYGLAAYAWTGDGDGHDARRIANEVEAGMTWIDRIGPPWPEIPFGGVKASGYGSEGGPEALAAYLATVTRIR
jgi:succinate-semialdehyde dehydrogenase/glutarate-semialdehyde dehydrogenase